MKSILSISSLLIIVFFFACKEDEDPMTIPMTESKPNILLVIGDDIGIDAFPGYENGATKPNLPHLNEMISNGLIFDNVWANPVCAPTRSTILTGKYGFRTGVLDASQNANISQDEKTLHKYLDEQTGEEYNHCLIGKWHLSGGLNKPTNMGIGYYAGVWSGGIDDYYNWEITENASRTQTEEYCTNKLTDLAIDWINDQEKPWFCWLAYTAAHTPFHVPPQEMHSFGNLPNDEASIDADPLPYYLSMVESLDYDLGRLMDNIPEDELDNTIIIFIGDNGTPGQVAQTPFSSNTSKGTLFQGGINVPMVISGKGVSRMGEREGNLINSTDLFATIVELAGETLESYEDSKSFKSLFTAAGPEKRTFTYADTYNDQPSRSGYAIRNEQFKLIQSDDGSQRFFDLLNDPYENNNLVNNLNANQEAALQSLLAEGEALRN